MENSVKPVCWRTFRSMVDSCTQKADSWVEGKDAKKRPPLELDFYNIDPLCLGNGHVTPSILEHKTGIQTFADNKF